MPARQPALRPLALLLGLPLALPAFAEDLTLKPVQVIGATPVPGIGLPKDEIPANVQSLDATAIRTSGDPSIADTMQRRLPSVTINETQGNPWQPNLNYRGFTASPLLGTPQGLSVFLDGVRVNEGFGDVVNWDILPHGAIAEMNLVPGSNPLFGLNTLGGTIVLQTKRGDTHPGGEMEASYGSFNRKTASMEYGAQSGNLHWYGNAEGTKEDGWRDFSPSTVGRLFSKLGWTDARTDLTLSMGYAHTDLTGNGLVPENLYHRHDDSVFTHPDTTGNRATLFALNGSHWLNDTDQVSGTAYLRRTRTRTFNGDLNDDYDEEYAADPATANSGVNHRTATDQNAAGLGVQWSTLRGIHQFAVGTAYDHSHARFDQTSQPGELTASRGVAADGEETTDNKLVGYTDTTSVYFTDTLELAADLHLTASAPYLKQVVSKTFELGARGRLPAQMAWNATLFRTTNYDDILFVGTSTSAGYFTNFGETRREGVELGLSGTTGTLDWHIHYSYLKATYQSSACLLAASNSSAGANPACGADEIRVTSGDRLPGLPEQALKLLLTWRPNDRLRLGADLVAYSDQIVRGHENGKQQAGEDFGGSGTLGGYTVVNVDGDYRLGGGWTAFGRIANLFDRRYATAGALAETPFNNAGQFQANPDDWRNAQFVAPGAPRAGWVGVRYTWGGK